MVYAVRGDGRMKRTVSAILLAILLTSMLYSAFKIMPAEAAGTIYIRADGSIDPPTPGIATADNITYTFTYNIYDSIVVERDNIVVDGGGYTVQGTGSGTGLSLSGRSNVTIKSITINAFYYGIWLEYSSNSSISGNNITANNEYGIRLNYSSGNSISGNTMANNGGGIGLWFSSNYNSISGNNITANTYCGIVLFYSSNYNSISGNNITANNYYGIVLSSSSDSSISGNNITNNYYGIWLEYSSSNSIFHNSFVNNINCLVISSVNVWDDGYPSGGNYWSNYTGVDLHSGSGQDETGSDGIGDTFQVIDGNNVDHYPLMAPFNTFDAGTWNGTAYNVDVVSNSTVSGFHFNPEEGSFLKFNVTGEEGTVGFCRVTIPKGLLWVEDGWTVYAGEESVNCTIIPDNDYTYLYFTYNHSTKAIVIQGTHVIPESPSFLILSPLFMIATLLAMAICKKRKKFHSKSLASG